MTNEELVKLKYTYISRELCEDINCCTEEYRQFTHHCKDRNCRHYKEIKRQIPSIRYFHKLVKMSDFNMREIIDY